MSMENEMLSFIEMLDEFCSMLLSANIHAFTNHKNLTFDSNEVQHLLHWRNKVEEYSPILH